MGLKAVVVSTTQATVKDTKTLSADGELPRRSLLFLLLLLLFKLSRKKFPFPFQRAISCHRPKLHWLNPYVYYQGFVEWWGPVDGYGVG